MRQGISSAGLVAVLIALAITSAGYAQAAPEDASPAPGEEREAGVTAASNSAEGIPPVSARRILTVGINVFERERVLTGANGQAQLLFLDGSSFTVGPDVDLVLDEFVYDPEIAKGRIAVSLGKGVFRFVGGKLSKDGSVVLTTPSAILGVRGGIALVEVGEGGATTATLLYGEALTVTARNGESVRIQRPGFSVNVPSPTTGPSAPRRAPAEQLRRGFEQLHGQTGRAGGLPVRPLAATVVAALRAPVAIPKSAAPTGAHASASASPAAPVRSPFPSGEQLAARTTERKTRVSAKHVTVESRSLPVVTKVHIAQASQARQRLAVIRQKKVP